ncbi:MAG: bifunctional methylenetetrahydrofolate dehydrogenase/methenyltetrahydrofolate cyclohydrolase FolD [Christensenellales bacterium]|jgi:methylenetetrahydrofolate dehydrogenase (NADP+)/methenyltetrahydrofolate cyclohydrolase
MSATIIDGKAVSQSIRGQLKQRVSALAQRGVQVGLAVVLVGEDPASAIYVRNKERACKQLGITSYAHRLPADTSEEDLLALVAQLNADPRVHGILVQLPLPGQIDEGKVIAAIDPSKDVDGFHVVSAGSLMVGAPGFVACTPMGCMRLIESLGVDVTGMHAVVVGRSNIVGKPAAMLLLQKNCTVTVCHSRTCNLGEITRQADLLVVAIGKANFITADMVKPGAIVIDVGMNRVGEKKVTGDVDYAPVSAVAGAITPVPGGVGPMTITMLMENTVLSAERHG